VNNQVNGCVGQKLEFDFWFKAADTDAILVAEDNHIFTMPNAIITYTHQLKDSIHGHFKWTPTSGGPKSFIVTAKDSTCKPPGIMLYYPYTIPIFIWDAVKTIPDTAVCPKENAYLDAYNGGNYVWSVLPGGGPITQLSCVNCQNPVVTAIQKTTYVVTSTLTTFCAANTDTVTVDILPGLVFQPLKDITTCPNNSVTLDLKPNPPPGVKYLVKWSPGKYLNDSTKSAVITTPKDSLTYFITLTSSANKCRGFDTVNVGVLTGFRLDNIDTAICDGAHVDVRATADPRYTILWEDDSAYSGIFSSNTVVNPTITPIKPGVKERFKMTLSYLDASNHPLCRDTSATFRIDYQPNPIVTVDKDAAMCAGDTMQMNGSVSPPYNYDFTWTPGSSLDNPKILNPIFSASQSTKLTLTAMTKEAKCTGSASVNLTVFPAAFLFASNDTAICPGESAQLHVTGNGVKTFRWIPDIRIDDPYSYNPMVSPPATQEYRVYAVDTNFCSDTAKVMVTVHPKATVELPDSVRIYPGQSYKFQPGGNCSYFSWYPPLGLNRANISNPIAQPEVNTRYFVTGITEAGCSASDSINVLVSSESLVDVANAFMPGSGTNGRFKILHLGDATLKSFEIYNRWGVKVYESTDINDGWDGTFKNEPQPIGVYVYSVEAVTPNGRKFTKQGNVTLIR